MPNVMRSRLIEQRKYRQWSQQELANRLGTTQHNVSRWERGLTTPGPYYRQQLCVLFGKDPQELELLLDRPAEELFPADSPSSPSPDIAPVVQNTNLPKWYVPYPRNPFFTGREELLRHLHEMLHQEHTMALTQSLAISGLGGIGKTQVALEYAYRYGQEYRYVFWASAATRETLLTDFAAIADHLQLPERYEQDQTKVLKDLRHWFAIHGGWLLILDNADDMTVVYDAVPSECPGHLLLTSRAQALGPLAQRINVEDMGIVEGMLFLLRRAWLLAPGAPLDSVSEANLAAAESIAIEMAFLPLALDQAGAYIDEVGCSLTAYLDLYRTRRKELLQRRGYVPSNHPESIVTTWSLSFQKIEQTNLAAANLLRLCAFLEPDTIPEELIFEANAPLDLALQPIAIDAFTLNEAVEELRKFSLVQRDPETRVLRIHRLVQAVLKDAMKTEDQHRWAERVVRATNTVFPQHPELTAWPRFQRYLPQAQICSTLIQSFYFNFAEAGSLLQHTARYLQKAALYEQAEQLFLQAMHIYKQTLEPSHPDVAGLFHSMAALYEQQGKYEQAESFYQQALHIREQILGTDHPDVAKSLDGLALVYYEQGKSRKAEPLLQRALHIYEQYLNVNQLDAAHTYNSLGLVYHQQGKFKQAEALFQQAARIWEHIIGPDCANIVQPLSNLALCYVDQGRYEEAESLYQRTLRISEQILGSTHPDVADSLLRLAIIYYQRGNYEKATLFNERALHIREQALGSDHPNVADALNIQAAILKAQGLYKQAEQYFQRALYIGEQKLGPDHPNIARPLNNLANLFILQEKYAQAEPLYQRALQIREQALGSDHPNLAHPLNGLANCYFKQKKYEQAESFYQRALSLREQHLKHHPDLAETLNDFAALREFQGKYQEAASLYQRALAIQEQVLGPDHPKTLETQAKYHATQGTSSIHTESGAVQTEK